MHTIQPPGITTNTIPRIADEFTRDGTAGDFITSS
jgi:hypothetical protein